MFKTKEEKVVAYINQTYDYDRFKTLEGNRNINKANVERLKKSMRENYLLCPIIVNKDWMIIDGQHRHQACKELNYPLYYFMCKGYGLNEVQKLNTNQKNWTNVDYLQSYCELGHSDYLEVRNFWRRNKFLALSNCLILLHPSHISLGHRTKKLNGTDVKINEFSEGKWINGDIELAQDLANQLYLLKNLVDFATKRNFVSAIKKLNANENFDFQVFLHKVKSYPGKIHDTTNTENCLLMIENLYNYRNREKVGLRYS